MFPNEIMSHEFAERVLGSKLPVLVLFVTTGAVPCRSIVQPLRSIMDDFVGMLSVVSIDADKGDNLSIAKKYEIKGVPTLMMFKAGERVNLMVGVAKKPQIAAFIERHA